MLNVNRILCQVFKLLFIDKITFNNQLDYSFSLEMMFVAEHSSESANMDAMQILIHRQPVLVENGCTCRFNSQPITLLGSFPFIIIIRILLFIKKKHTHSHTQNIFNDFFFSFPWNGLWQMVRSWIAAWILCWISGAIDLHSRRRHRHLFVW